jgi:ankyrin repeat protein
MLTPLVSMSSALHLTIHSPSPSSTNFNTHLPPLSHRATKGGHLACMRALLKANAQMHSVGGARPALCWAAASGQLEALQLLLASKASCRDRDSFGYTPLLDATKGGHGAVVQCLLSSGADVNAQTKSGASSLSLASERNDLPMVLLLLAALPNLALTTEAGHTAENLARMAGHNEVYRTLAAARTASSSGSSSARSQAGAEGKQL